MVGRVERGLVVCRTCFRLGNRKVTVQRRRVGPCVSMILNALRVHVEKRTLEERPEHEYHRDCGEKKPHARELSATDPTNVNRGPTSITP